MNKVKGLSRKERWKFYIYALIKLPTLAWWGVKPVSLDSYGCVVQVSYSWRTQNPFRSIYFSVLLGTAELSTGLLVMRLLSRNGDFSMLVVDAQASFSKKATGVITFTCDEGQKAQKAIDLCQEKGSAQSFELKSIGRNKDGIEVCSVIITWSIKNRK